MRKTLKSLLCILLLSVTFTIAVKASINVPTPTNPNGYVEDYAGVLSADAEKYIKELNDDLVNNYSGCVVVVTVNYYPTANIEDYALAIFNQWKIGNASTNDGVLFLMSIGDDDYYICTGRGLENTLTVSILTDIIDFYTEPPFAKKNYDSCASQTVKALHDELVTIYENQHGVKPSPTPTPSPTPQTSKDYSGLVFIIILLVLLVIFISWRRNRRRTVYVNNTRPYTIRRPSYYTRPRPTSYYVRPSSSYHTYHRPSSGSSWSSSSHSSSSHSGPVSSGSSYRPSSSGSTSRHTGGSSRGSGTGRH